MTRGGLTASLALLAALGLLACDEDTAGGEGGAGGTGGAAADAFTGDALLPDAEAPLPDTGGGGEGGMPDLDAAAGGGGDAALADVGPGGDAAVVLPDMAVARPDVGPLDGMECDPRRNAAACEPGYFCVHVPGERPFIGRCQMADNCRPGYPEDCPDPARPYCHLKGAGTFCAAAGQLRAGEECVNDLRIPQPCADGLLCNFSVCQARCDTAGGEPACEDNFRCEDISASVAAENVGLCQPPSCDWFTGRGCDAGEKCGYTIRNDGQVTGSCFEQSGNNQAEAPCGFAPGGGDNCGPGLVCTGPPNRERFCKILCDTGGYQAPCPENMRCTEALSTQQGAVRGLGFCITNQ